MNQKSTTDQPKRGRSSTTGGPRIYVASLADYNCGILHGRWIEADQDAESVHAAITDMLEASTQPIAEEWAIHDYDGFGPIRIEEYEDVAIVARAAELIIKHGAPFAELVEHFGGLDCLDDALRTMEEGYCGEYESVEAYAAEMLEDAYADVLGKLPDLIRYNIDWDSIANDLQIGGDVICIRVNHHVHVFHGNI